MMKKTLIYMLVLLCLLNVLSCKTKRVLEAYLVDAHHQRPLQDKKIRVDGVEYLTDHRGALVVSSIEKDTVLVEVEADDLFQAFSDNVVLYQNYNIRKFLIEARHPLDLPSERSFEPYNYTVAIQSGEKTKPGNVEMMMKSIPFDDTFEYIGTYVDEWGVTVKQNMVQIGFNFWYKDEFDYWQFSSLPPAHFPLWGMIIDAYVRVMYQFYYDLDYTYKLDPEEVLLNDEQVRKITVTPLEKNELLEEMTIYMISQGEHQGMIRQAELKLKDHAWLGNESKITFLTMNTVMEILPPDITH
jgi:hypothetical protein